jgi:hypothetical protein
MDKVAPAAGVRAVRSGAWSDPGVWGGKRPTGGAVFIPNGISVVADIVDPTRLKSVRVEGCLELSSSANSRITTETLYIAPKGELIAGAANAPMPPHLTSEIVFSNLGALNASVDPKLFGKGLISASRVQLYGVTKAPRAALQRAPRKGEQVIALTGAPAGWRVGDRIVIPGTRWIAREYDGDTDTLSAPTEDEVRYVKSISGASITLDAPLLHDHPSPDGSYFGYVLNYTRNIRLATENGATVPVTQRAHAMAMSPETFIQGVEFFEMGRTDKSLRAIDASLIGATVYDDDTNTSYYYAPSPTANIKGRYPFHVHQAGFPADDLAPVIRDTAVWGSPGWGFAHHNSKAFFFRNNTFNTFGAGFVAESGNETGAWVENNAVRAVGLARLVKDGADVAAFDLARTGDGFWLQSRMVRLHRNFAAGMMSGMGYVFMHRGTDLPGLKPLSIGFAAAEMCVPSISRNLDQFYPNPNIQQFTDNEVMAAYVGFHVVKSDSITSHDIPSVIDNFKAYEVVNGIELTYSSRYLVKNATLVGAAYKTQWRRHTGVLFGPNVYGATLVDSKVSKFDYAVDLEKQVSTPSFLPAAHAVIGLVSSNIYVSPFLNRDATDLVLASAPAARRATMAYKWGSGPTFIDQSGTNSIIRFQGVKTDSLGQTAYPLIKDEFILNYDGRNDLMKREGWYKLASGEKALVAQDYFADRLTGEVEQARVVARLHYLINPPTTRLDGKPAYLGLVNPSAAAPSAVDDSVSVAANGVIAIDVLQNDASVDGKRVNSYLPARNGNVRRLPDGRLEYRPYPEFKGQDSFVYWVANREGAPAKARARITVY